MNQWNYMYPNLAHIRHSQPNNGMSDQIMVPYSAAYSTPGTIQETQLRLNNTPQI